MKKIISLIIVTVLTLNILSCTQNSSTTSSKTEIWTTKAGSSVCAWFSGEESEDSMGINTEPTVMRVGKTQNGKEFFSLIRLPMHATWFGDEIESARLYLKVKEGEVPTSLHMGLIKNSWGSSITTRSDAEKLFDSTSMKSVAVRKEQNGWVSMDISDFVKDWVNGNIPNYGLAFFGENTEGQTVFVSDWNGETQDPPRLEVTGTIGNRDLSYGAFDYIRHPENPDDDSKIAEDEVANCMSYALRDTNVIGAEELMLDYAEMTRIYRESGENAVADYCAAQVTDYVEEHKTGLKISSFRKIDNFDSEINPAEEYRIALRVGCRIYDEEEVFDVDEGNFDYHFWAQMNNGQWAQKFMFDPSEIVPYCPPGVSPEKYPWDASLTWENDNYNGFYTSKVIYFAVTKDTNGFTQHKGE